jgi:hypothetical protein
MEESKPRQCHHRLFDARVDVNAGPSEASEPPESTLEDGSDIKIGDYVRIDWRVPRDLGDVMQWSWKPVWVEGEVMRVHRPGLDLVADVRIDRSNFMQVGSVEGIGIGGGAARRIPRPGSVVAVEPPRQPSIVIHNHYDPGPLAEVLTSEAGQKVVMNVLRSNGNPIRQRAEEAAVEASVSTVCQLCRVDISPTNAWQHAAIFPDGPWTFVTCTGESCMWRAQRVIEGAEELRTRALQGGTSGVPIGKAPREVSPELRAQLDEIRRSAPVEPMLDPADPPPRPDGFSQSAVDAAKAVLLAPVARRGAK